MKFATFFCVALSLIAVYVEEIQCFDTLTEDVLSMMISPKTLSDPSWPSSSGIIKARSSFSYSANTDNQVILKAPAGYVIFAAIRVLDLRPNKEDNLTLFIPGDDRAKKIYQNDSPFQKRFEDSDEKQNTFFAYNGQLGIRFQTGASFFTTGYDGFKLVYTVQKNATCQRFDYFTCNNGRCINKMITCDGHNHCGDGSDQTDCGDIPYIPKDILPSLRKTAGQIAGIVCGVLFALIVVGGLIVFLIIRRSSARTRTQGAVVSNPGYR